MKRQASSWVGPPNLKPPLTTIPSHLPSIQDFIGEVKNIIVAPCDNLTLDSGRLMGYYGINKTKAPLKVSPTRAVSKAGTFRAVSRQSRDVSLHKSSPGAVHLPSTELLLHFRMILNCFKSQAASFKSQAAGIKLQAAGDKLQNFFAFIKFHVSRSKVLRKDKTIVRMFHVERDLVWRKCHSITFGYF